MENADVMYPHNLKLYYFCNKYQNVFFAYWIKIPGHGSGLHATSSLLFPRQSTPPKRAGCSTFLVIVFVPPPQGSVQLVASLNCDHLQLTLKRWTYVDYSLFWQNNLYVIINLVLYIGITLLGIDAGRWGVF